MSEKKSFYEYLELVLKNSRTIAAVWLLFLGTGTYTALDFIGFIDTKKSPPTPVVEKSLACPEHTHDIVVQRIESPQHEHNINVQEVETCAKTVKKHVDTAH